MKKILNKKYIKIKIIWPSFRNCQILLFIIITLFILFIKKWITLKIQFYNRFWYLYTEVIKYKIRLYSLKPSRSSWTDLSIDLAACCTVKKPFYFDNFKFSNTCFLCNCRNIQWLLYWYIWNQYHFNPTSFSFYNISHFFRVSTDSA